MENTCVKTSAINPPTPEIMPNQNTLLPVSNGPFVAFVAFAVSDFGDW